MINYDRIRFVYETPIHRFTRDALPTAVAEAIRRAEPYHKRFGVEAKSYAFRVIANSYVSCADADADVWESRSQLEIVAFPIVKQTETGFRIWRGSDGRCGETRWISYSWTKRWASTTPDGALRDFAARKKRQASIYDARAKAALREAAEAKALLTKEQEG